MNTPFFDALRAKVDVLGGLHNAHLHLCRAGTLAWTETLFRGKTGKAHSYLSIAAKHGIIPLIHDGAEYQPRRLEARARFYLDQMLNAGTTRADTLVDVTVDRVGTSAFEIFQKLKSEYKPHLELQIGSYSPLGFINSEGERWRLIEDTAKHADFVGGLPERDDTALYRDHIGYEESCARVISLSYSLGKRVHIHVDQKNDPAEDGTRRVFSVIDSLRIRPDKGEPLIWLVHVISPSGYNDSAFDRLVDGLSRRNIGVICCPSAAISMRQLRPLRTPTHNSIARVLEFLAAGIKVRLGSDNINDITSPAGTPDLMNEVFVLCNALRFYDIDILAKLAAGKFLNRPERNLIRTHLRKDQREVSKSIDLLRRRSRQRKSFT